MKQDLRGSPCTKDFEVASGKNVSWCCNIPANCWASPHVRANEWP